MRIAILLVSSVLASAAIAHDETPCTSEPEAKWQPFSAAVRKAEMEGNTVKNAEVHHKCYEIRGKTADGKRFEWVLNPVTLKPRAAGK